MIRKVGISLIVIIGCGGITSALAQEKETKPRVTIERERIAEGPERRIHVQGAPERVVIERHMQGPEGHPPPGDYIFLATEMSFGGPVVKGAPYSAQAVTESTQSLIDGNRIINRSTASVYRDSEGRTRREQTLKSMGPFARRGEPHQTIFISDPVAGTSYTLVPSAKIARKMPPLRLKMKSKAPKGEPGTPGIKQEVKPGDFEVHIGSDELIEKKVTEVGVSMGWIDARNENARTEDLGKQNIEGVEAEGKRTTVTIPAGEIGNERAIEIVSERWYSPELQAIVMTRHSDPRFGENTYRLTNISRGEQARSLFEVPGDYTIKEAGVAPEGIRMRKPAPPPEQ